MNRYILVPGPRLALVSVALIAAIAIAIACAAYPLAIALGLVAMLLVGCLMAAARRLHAQCGLPK